MTKTPAKFQKNRYESVGGVPPPPFIHFVIYNAWTKFNLQKSNKK